MSKYKNMLYIDTFRNILKLLNEGKVVQYNGKDQVIKFKVVNNEVHSKIMVGDIETGITTFSKSQFLDQIAPLVEKFPTNWSTERRRTNVVYSQFPRRENN